MDKLLLSYAQQPMNKRDLVAAGIGQGAVIFRKNIYINSDFSKLPAPPDDGLMEIINEQSTDTGYPPFYLNWFPDQNIGTIYYFSGAGGCQNWFFFVREKQKSTSVDAPQILEPPACGGDGLQSAIVKIHAQVVALLMKKGATSSGRFVQLSWQIWKDGGWTSPQCLVIQDTSK